MKESIDYLNQIYEKLHNRAMKLESELTSGGFDCSWGWYNYRTVGENHEVRYYPVPVITAHGLGDICLDLDSCCFTASYTKNGLLSLELEKLVKKFKFEIFIADEETVIIYKPSDKPTEVRTKAFSTIAERLCICVYMTYEQDFNSMREVLAEFRVPEEKI
jgi:hypothetical protein